MVIKRDGRREPFSMDKIEQGIQRSMQKRPVSQKDIEEMLHAIEDEAALISKNSREIRAEEIGEMVLKKLYELDGVAYVRFASVYRMFDNVDEFINEIEKLTR
jgi:transcriptional repressor NrdR